MFELESLPLEGLNQKTVVVTGANAGLGFEAASFLARHGARVILGVRDPKRGEAALARLRSLAANADLRLVPLDLGDSRSIDAFISTLKQEALSVDILINNAGIMAVPYSLTKDGYETQIGVNHLGHFRLTLGLLEILAPDARIVNVSSMAHRSASSPSFDHFMYEKGGYTPFGSYARSKVSNLWFTFALARRLAHKRPDIRVRAAHPGVSATSLFTRNQSALFKTFMGTFAKLSLKAEDGVRPILAAALDPESPSTTYYGPVRKGKKVLVRIEQPTALAKNEAVQERLWAWSLKVTGLSDPFMA